MSYQCQQDTSSNQCQTYGHDLSSYVSMRPKLISHSNQSGVSISTDVFEVEMLQAEVNRRYYNSYIMLCIYSTAKIGAIKMYINIYISHD